MSIDVDVVVNWIKQLGIILGVIIAAYKLVDKHILKRFTLINQRLYEHEKRMNDLEIWSSKQQEDINDGAERWRIIIDGMLACLYGLKEQGCNGAVTDAIKTINSYVSSRAYKTLSKNKNSGSD